MNTSYLKAKNVLSPEVSATLPVVSVDAEMPVIDMLPRFLDAPGRILGVTSNGEMLGVVTESSLLNGLDNLIAPRDDSSLICLACLPEDYSASRIAHAVEDAGAHLVDLLSVPAADGRLLVTIRVRMSDPSSAIHHLERYGYEIIEANGKEFIDAETADERLRQIRMLINV